MNILVIHEVDWLEKVVFDIHFIAEGLSRLGHTVYAIDYEDRWKRKGPFDLGTLRTREFEAGSRAWEGTSIRLRRPGFVKIPGLARISALFTHYAEIGRTIREKHIDAVLLYSVPTNGFQAIRLGKKYRVPVLFRSIDILNMLVSHPLLSRVTHLLEKQVYSRADMVLPNTPRYENYVLGMGAPREKVELVPFPVDTELFHPAPPDPALKAEWKLGDPDRVIVFIGTLFGFSGLDDYLQEFPRVLEEVPEAKLLIVGDGPQREKLEALISGLGIEDRVTITGFQPYRQMPDYINLAEVCINTFRLNEETRDVFPAKIMQYVACGKPTVATALLGIKTILPGESHGMVYAETAEAMATETVSLLKSEERRNRIGRSGLENIRNRYGWKETALALEEIITRTIKGKNDDR